MPRVAHRPAHHVPPFRRALLATMIALPLAAAAPQQPPAGVAASMAPTELRTVGLGLHDGHLLGAGPDYKVTFADEVLFTPALGSAAPHNLPLGYRLEAVGRGDATQAVAPVAPVAVNDRVVYEHGVTTARYTLRADGVEQDFVFTQLPPGRGDLVVRGRVRTELPVAFAAKARLDFAIDGIGGVRIGAVIGIDAAGRRAAGELRLAGDVLEYRLPAAFVDAATLPLVVDPLLGAITSITTINADTEPDVAYDATSDTWLIVWSREFSSTNSDIRGQRVLGTGALQGGLLTIESGSTAVALEPSVGNVAMRDAFVVAWRQASYSGATAPGIHARGVVAATGALTTAVVVRSATLVGRPKIGGEANETADDEVLCLWSGTTTPEWCQISYTAAGTLAVFPWSPAGLGTNDFDISPTGGQSGRYLVAWVSSSGTLGGQSTRRLECRVVDRNQNFLGTPRTLRTSTGQTGSGVTFGPTGVDGDGDSWTVGYEEQTLSFFTPFSSIVHAVPVVWSGGDVSSLPSTSVTQQGAPLNTRPSVCRLQDSSLLAWGAGDDLRLTSIDSFNCEVCEGSYLVDASANTVGSSTMSWRGSPGAPNSGEALLVWSATNPGGQIRFQRFEANDGTITQVQPACGNGGALRASCAFISHTMRFQLTDTAPNAPSLLVFSLDRFDYDCGACTLVPDPFAGFVTGLATTSALGTRAFDLVLPSSASGRRFYAQYATAGTGCLGGFDVSSALSIRIQ